jgi:hypothetical protein
VIQTWTIFDTRRIAVTLKNQMTDSGVVQKQAEISRCRNAYRFEEQRRFAANSSVQELLNVGSGVSMMSLVRLLGFTTLGCGCVTGRYREVATNREITYVEEKGASCTLQAHRRNHTLTPARVAVHTVTAKAS